MPIINDRPDDLYKTVFSIPVGENSVIQYRGGDNPNMEITGPNAIAVLPDGSFMIADLIANRLLHYDKTGYLLNTIDLYELGIVNVADLRIQGDMLFLLEISLNFSPPRYRVNQLSLTGILVATHDIPEGFHIENGLTGIAIDCEGQIVLEMAGGSDLYRLEDIQRNSDMTTVPNGYQCDNRIYQIINPGPQKPPAIVTNDVIYETQLTTGWGGFNILDMFGDGSFFVLREDVVNGQIIQVDLTVHYIGSDMVSQGVARAPIDEAYYYIMRDIAVTTQGDVFMLLPRHYSLDVIQLNFYREIEPLIPGSIPPEIAISISSP